MARQAPEESCLNWADRLMALATHAFPNLSDEVIQGQVINTFCQGASDREAGQHAVHSRPQTLEEAVDLVRGYKNSHGVASGAPRRDGKQIPPSEKAFSETCNVHRVCALPPTQQSSKDDSQASIPGLLIAGNELPEVTKARPSRGTPFPGRVRSPDRKIPCLRGYKFDNSKHNGPEGRTEKSVAIVCDEGNDHGSV